MPASPDLDTLEDERAVAARLGVTIRCLQTWRYKGSGGPPFVRVGSLVRYRRRDVIAFIDANTVGGAR